MSKRNNKAKIFGLGGIAVFTVVVFVLFSGSGGTTFFDGNTAQLSLVSGQGKFSCDAWNEIATVTNGVTRTVASGNQDFNALFDSSLLSLNSNVDALKLRLVIQCDDNFIEDSRSTTVSGSFKTKICGSGSPEICYVGQDRFFNNLQGVATSSTVFTDVPISTRQISADQRVVLWEGSIGKSQIEAIGKEGGITFTSRMYPQLTFTFDHPTLGVFTGRQDSFATGDLIYAQYSGVTLTAPPPPDTDGDGITDNIDACVGQPEDFNSFEDTDGCPDAFKLVDVDGDGITDVNDDCPNLTGVSELNGCPLVDTDGDNVADSIDVCSGTTSGESVDFDGCSQPQLFALSIDTDNDGVPDVSDSCPTSFGRGTDGCNITCTTQFLPVCGSDGITYPNECFALNNMIENFEDGVCEDPFSDLDNDGINDSVDSCPNSPFNTVVDSTGCETSIDDSDNDGVLDSIDACLTSPPNASVDANGCEIPVTGSIFDGDFDGDGIPDGDDDCPASGGTVDQFGCPETENPIEQFFDDIFDQPSEPLPPVDTSPQTTTTGSPSQPTLVSDLPDSIVILGIILIIILVVVAVAIKSGKAKL